MDCRPLAFRQVPHQPKLFLEYLDHFEKVKSFYFHPPALTAVTRATRKLDYSDDRRAEVISVLRRQNIALGAQIEPLVREAAELLANQGSDLLAQYLVESYRPEETYGSAFGKLFARLFAQHGLVLMDPLDDGLHKVAAPLYQHALAERDALNEKLLQRGKDLDRVGFDAQVRVTARSTLLFRLDEVGRIVVPDSAGNFNSGVPTWVG